MVFAYSYLITFEDSMAYGSHHFLTNFKFQCAAREALFFLKIVENQHDWHEEFNSTLFLTAEGYSRNLSPVRLGEKAIVFMTFEDPTPRRVRLCFRTVSGEGVPVACGYQTIVCTDRAKNVVAQPKSLAQFYDLLAEPLTSPSFKERALQGGGSNLASIFPESILDSARKLALAPARDAFSQVMSVDDMSVVAT